MKISNKFKKLLSVMLALVMVVGIVGITPRYAKAADGEEASTPSISINDDVTSDDFVVLFDNDVHCAIDGYANMAAAKADMKEKTKNVVVVSAGDFAQGATAGSMSKGENIVKIMNKVGYDVVTLGNHEFDYKLDQTNNIVNSLTAKVVCANFVNLKTNKAVYSGYTMKKFGDKKVAFVGIATPESVDKSTPTYFQDSKGNYIYGFCGDKTGKALYKRVQTVVDKARAKGADYVVAIGHLGMEGTTARWKSSKVIKNTTGIDVLLDAHSHESFIKNMKNKDGKNVICAQTGTKFANIGKLVITKEGKIKAEVVSTSEYTKKDGEVETYIEQIKKELAEFTSQVIGKTKYDLTIFDPVTEKRQVRKGETNLGDFCADAMRTVLGADIGIMNGGGVRADIAKGDITYDNLLTVFPFGNMGCVCEATGQQIKDALEMGASLYPEECGGFLQVSGLKYTINSAIPSSVKKDDQGMFISVDGKYRVSNIKVLNKKTGKYEKLNLKKTYTVAGLSYTMKSCGDGFTMFKDNKYTKDEIVVDNQVLVDYLKNNLKGVVSSDYKNPAGQGRIKIK